MKFKSRVLLSPAASQLRENFTTPVLFMPPVYSAPRPAAVLTDKGRRHRRQPPCCVPCLTSRGQRHAVVGTERKGGGVKGARGGGGKQDDFINLYAERKRRRPSLCWVYQNFFTLQ